MRAAPALVVLLLSAVPAPVDAAEPELVVRGTRSGYVDVRITEPFTAETAKTHESYRDGRIAGFWAERLNQPAGTTPDRFGVMRIAHLGGVATARMVKDIPPPPEESVYQPGTYRFHVVADGPFELTLPTTGLKKALVVSPRRWVAKPRLTVSPGAPGAANTTWDSSQRFTIGAGRKVVVSLSLVRWSGTGAHQSVLCFGEPGGGCDEDHRHVVTTVDGSVGVGGQRHGTDAVFVLPGRLRAGAWDAFQQSYTPPGATFTAMHGMVLVFDAPLPR